MKILHLSAVNNWGGGENQIELLCEEFKANYPEIENIILCVKDGLFHRKLKITNLNYKIALLSFNFDFRYSLKICQICKKDKIDLIHIHDPKALNLVILANKFYDLPPFIFSKKTSFPIKQRKQTLYKYNYSKIQKYLCVSYRTQEVMKEAIEDRDKLTVIYHGTGIDNKNKPAPFLLKQKYKLAAGKKIIGNIANHIRSKNLECFLKVAHELIHQQQQTDLYFIQIGSFDKETPTLQQKILDLNLENHVQLTGYLPDASRFLPQFDISLVTSHSEGLPQVIYESFYYEIPVISTAVGGIPEVIKDGENGLLASSNDYKKLVEHIVFLLKNPKTVQKFTKLSKVQLLKHYTTKKMTKKTLKEYKKVLNNEF